jgi:hypothetical protein
MISMFDEISPVIIAERTTTKKRKIKKMIPVVEADELLQINSFFYAMKTLK